MEVKWNALKSERLKKVRGVSFEEIIQAELVGIRMHPQNPNQQILLFLYAGYIGAVPFVEEGENMFLKTLYPSRKYNKLFQRGELL
jgi:hypothetical protein